MTQANIKLYCVSKNHTSPCQLPCPDCAKFCDPTHIAEVVEAVNCPECGLQFMDEVADTLWDTDQITRYVKCKNNHTWAIVYEAVRSEPHE